MPMHERNSKFEQCCLEGATNLYNLACGKESKKFMQPCQEGKANLYNLGERGATKLYNFEKME